MPEQWVTGSVARWEVIWWSKKGKKFIVKTFDNDLQGATELFVKVKGLKAPFATLRCCNVGFPPPDEYRPYTKQYVQRTKVKRRGKTVTKKTIVEREIIPMEELNLKGIWWCPYCCQMRKIVKRSGMVFRDGEQEYYLDGTVYVCPVCEISHTNHHVRRWNPHAQRMPFRPIKQTRVRKSSGSRRTTRGRRRRA